jgi:hypothetical protein
MKILKETKVILSKSDLDMIIKEYLLKNGIELDSIDYDINGHNREDDYFSQYSL